QAVYRPRRQPLGLRPGGAYTEQRHEGRFGDRRVLSGGFPQLIGRGGGVEHVVVDLEGEAHVGAVATQRLAGPQRRARREAADDTRGGDQGAGLATMYVLELLRWQASAASLRLEIQGLAADHPPRPRRPKQLEGHGPPAVGLEIERRHP